MPPRRRDSDAERAADPRVVPASQCQDDAWPGQLRRTAAGSSDRNRALVERIRAERERALAADPDVEDALPADKTDFPIGIRPDGSVNRGDRDS